MKHQLGLRPLFRPSWFYLPAVPRRLNPTTNRNNTKLPCATGGLVIDLRRMRDVEIDATARVATLQRGATAAHLISA
jgi:hypothetical protein